MSVRNLVYAVVSLSVTAATLFWMEGERTRGAPDAPETALAQTTTQTTATQTTAAIEATASNPASSEAPEQSPQSEAHEEAPTDNEHSSEEAQITIADNTGSLSREEASPTQIAEDAADRAAEPAATETAAPPSPEPTTLGEEPGSEQEQTLASSAQNATQEALPPETTAEETTAPIAAAAQAPKIDIIRIELDGSGLIAGRSDADSEVDIVVSDEIVAKVRTGPDGAFVAMFQAPDVGALSRISARTATGDDSGDGRAGANLRESAPLFVLPDASGDAPVVVAATNAGLDLVQPPARLADAPVALDAISYDDAGRVWFSGRAGARSTLRLYLDDELAVETAAGLDGSWRATATAGIAPGVYRLRVDETGPDGEVRSRLETPFLREAFVQGEIGDHDLIVQAGDNLWRIAEAKYGAGDRYTLIFRANEDAIRDPDLIYPGQVFTLPDEPKSQ